MIADSSSMLVSQACLAKQTTEADTYIPVTVVGYSHHKRANDPCGGDDRLYWIVLNSWGPKSGHGGYIYSMWYYIWLQPMTAHLPYSRNRKLSEYDLGDLLQREGMLYIPNTQRSS
jgi:C1A family cysteine protease